MAAPVERYRMTVENGLSSKSLGAQYRPFGNIAVPFDQGRNRTTPGYHVTEKVPDACRHFPIVAVDEKKITFVISFLCVSCQMDLAHMFEWEVGEVVARGVTLVRRRDEDVVDVEQQAAASAVDESTDEVRFGHRRITKGDIGRWIFQ
jgi:hypothetical protein